MTKKNILIATGGTGGHIFPAISLANNLLKKNFNVKLTTDTRGWNFLKDHKNFKLIKIPSSPLIKTTPIKLLISIMVIIYSIFQSFLFLLLSRPSIIFGMGGYSSFPICIAASILRIKFVIYENNLIIGKANKYLLPFTKKVFVSYKELEGIPRKYNYKIVEVGNILREEILKSKLNDQKNKFDSVKILVLGGSQGAKIFAEKLPYIFEQLKNNEIPIRIYQQCQKKQNDQLSEFYKKAKIDYEIFNFTNRITNYYSKVNLVITRSGASALGEIINFNIPFITIPLPTSADNHQYKNAEFYSKKGYGYLIEEKDIKIKLYNLVELFFNNKSLKDNIVFKQKQHSDKDFFDKLYIQLERLLDEKN